MTRAGAKRLTRFAGWLTVLALLGLAVLDRPASTRAEEPVSALDHFKCYDVKGEPIEEDIAFLRDQFALEDQTFEKEIVGRAEVFCNPTRKVHDGGGAGISDLDNHLTWYRIKPAIKERFTPREVLVTNQFAPNGQRLQVQRPEFLAVPTQKLMVNGQPTDHAFPEGLDHFKCYAVQAEKTEPASIRLWDQFGPVPPGDPGQWDEFRVAKPVYLCNPVAKIHVLGFDAAGAPHLSTAQVRHPEAHLVCYNLEPDRRTPRDLVLRNQFGAEQKLSTTQARLLCAPSKKGHVPPPLGVNPAVLTAFDELEAHIAGIPNDVLNQGQRRSLLTKLEKAEDEYRNGAFCPGYDLLNAYLQEVQALRQGGGNRPDPQKMAAAEDLYNRGRSLRDSFFDIFFDDPNLVPPNPCFDPSQRQEPRVSVQRSDNTGMTVGIAWGGPTMWTVARGGETWTQLAVPGAQYQVGPPARPAVPTWQTLVAVPHGATPVLVNPQPSLGESIYVNLYPFQDQAADQEPEEEEPLPPRETFMDPPFVKDDQTYGANALYPPDPCAIRPLGQYRDLQMAQVECAVGQYNPVTDELRLFTAVQLEIRFDGGEGTFITNQSLSSFESAPTVYTSAVLNKAVLDQYVKVLDFAALRCFGEELLILTHPDFRAAADTLAQWKRDKGIATTVIEVGAGTAHATAGAIDDLIEERYDECVVRPSYVLLMGDAEFVPPARTDYDTTAACGNCGDMTTGSDWGYAIYPQFLFDIFPDFGVGRIPVDTAGEAETVVDKIVQYESSPPFVNLGSGGPFYTTASVASYFQCCRTDLTQAGRDMRSFVETSEVVRNQLQGSGYNVERIFNTDTGYASDPVSDATPRRYYNGTSLPADLAPASGFGWNGSTQDVVDAFNAGRFNILHRDHGGTSGWGDPPFGTGNFGSLSNGELLPVVYSVNCSSGFFDRETDSGSTTESFMERLLLMSGGGMVGGLGDVRNSPTWANSALTRGFYDATWPNLAPEYGGATVHRRLGDILNHGKVYLLTQVGVAQTAGSVSLDAAVGEIIMWHAYGDPTLEMWTANPHRLVLTKDFTLRVLQDRIVVDYAVEGAMITALHLLPDGSIQPLARAAVKGGVAEAVFLNPQPEPPSAGSIILAASLPNAVSVNLQAPEGQGHPDLAVRQLTLESTILNPGEDLTGQLGVKVANLGSAQAPGTVNLDGSVKPGYMVDLVLSQDGEVPAGFAAVPEPAGVAFVEDGLLQGGRVSRTPDVAAASDVELSPAPPISSDVGGVIPTQTPPGDYFLCARIDPGAAVAESNEDNNVTCLPVQVVTVPRPVG